MKESQCFLYFPSHNTSLAEASSSFSRSLQQVPHSLPHLSTTVHQPFTHPSMHHPSIHQFSVIHS
jgi:hypothetical protein